MIRAHAGGLPKCVAFINGRKIEDAFAVWALWNGGPGIVGYFPRTASGHHFLSVEQDDVARAYLLGLVRLEFI